MTVALNGNYTAGATTINFTDISAGSVNTTAIIPGVILSLDLELFLVTGSPSGGTVSVFPGYLGSSTANHTSGALVYIRRRFTDFQCLQQINNVLDELGGEGLYNLAQVEVTYNAIQQGYDLTDVNTSVAISNYIEGIAARYKTPLPDRKYRTIPADRWEVLPMASFTVDPNYPSGYQFILNDDAWPGQNILFLFKQGFTHLANYADNVQTTALFPPTANDILPMGAMLRMVPPREVQRNQMQAQPDGRLATEVPPGAIGSSVNMVRAQYEMRINQEKARLKRIVGQFRRRY